MVDGRCTAERQVRRVVDSSNTSGSCSACRMPACSCSRPPTLRTPLRVLLDFRGWVRKGDHTSLRVEARWSRRGGGTTRTTNCILTSLPGIGLEARNTDPRLDRHDRQVAGDA